MKCVVNQNSNPFPYNNLEMCPDLIMIKVQVG